MKTYYKIILTTFLLLCFNACEKEEEHNHDNNEITGCDEEASNYDPNANEDDGSCEYRDAPMKMHVTMIPQLK